MAIINMGDNELEYVSENKNFIKPIRQITIFFDYRNFLFTPYKTSDQMHICMVIENYEGNEFHFSIANCGYGGTGPHKGLRILELLDCFTEDFLKNYEKIYMYYPGVRMLFSENGELSYITNHENTIFESRDHKANRNQLYVNTLLHYNLVVKNEVKTVYIREFKSADFFKSYLKILSQCSVIKIEYTLGKEELSYNIGASDLFVNTLSVNNPKEINVVILGENFDIRCLISKNNLINFLNTTWFYLANEELVSNVEVFKKDDGICRRSKLSAFMIRLIDKHSKKDKNISPKVVFLPKKSKDYK